MCKENGKIYCYAYWMAQRLRGRYGYPKDKPFRPTFHRNRLKEPYEVKKPSKIFAVSMGEMFGDWVPNDWIYQILGVMRGNPQHIFQVLTQNPKRLIEFNGLYPKNLWLGITVNRVDKLLGIDALLKADVKIHFLSFEPLLEQINPLLIGIQWIIIGAKTGKNARLPKREWVNLLVDVARDDRIPIFLKDNLHWHKKIQEFPFPFLGCFYAF